MPIQPEPVSRPWRRYLRFRVRGLIVLVLLVGGCILCSVGLVGEYVGRIYDQVKARPLYVLKETSPVRGLGHTLRTEEAA